MGSKTKKKDKAPTSSSSPSTQLSSERQHQKERYRSNKERQRREKRKRKDKERDRHRRKFGRDGRKKRKRDSDSDINPASDSNGPEEILRVMLKEFPSVGGDLNQLLQMIDDGQAVDIKGISEEVLIKHLKKLFISLNLKEKGDGIFLLPSGARPTLHVIHHVMLGHIESKGQVLSHSVSDADECPVVMHRESNHVRDESHTSLSPMDVPSASGKRMIGPQMPSAELLAAAARLTEAQAELREAEMEEDNELFIGPPPPAMVAEAESANEAERFEEVTRIMGAESEYPYDVLGINRNTSVDNVKKRYWKLSLFVHPDKCSHPQAHQAFVILNKAFKELQDPDKRKALDEKIKLKEQQEEFKAELQAMCEAAQWRRLQGISMEGDDELLASMEVKVPPKREEWMTTLPPERKHGVSMQSTRGFSKSSNEGRGDTSVWTDTPSDRAQKSKMNYLDAYNEALALASNEVEKKMTADAELVDRYNKEKRGKSLIQKHQEEAAKLSKKKVKQEVEKEEWEGKHPWKPWDREKDLMAGRQSIKFDTENMAQGLSSRFSSGNFQRNFL